jgi:hypothetical protein
MSETQDSEMNKKWPAPDRGKAVCAMKNNNLIIYKQVIIYFMQVKLLDCPGQGLF